jgi:hypothetical protein
VTLSFDNYLGRKDGAIARPIRERRLLLGRVDSHPVGMSYTPLRHPAVELPELLQMSRELVAAHSVNNPSCWEELFNCHSNLQKR